MGLGYVSAPLKDSSFEEYCSDLFSISKQLSHFLDVQRKPTFVHCSSGVSRAPTLALTYLCVFKRVSSWASVEKTNAFVKSTHPSFYPN